MEPIADHLRKFVAPEFVFGSGCRSLAGRYAANFGARHALLVTRRASSYLSRHQAARGRLLPRATAAVTTSVRSGLRVTVDMCDQLRVAPDHRRGLFSRAWV